MQRGVNDIKSRLARRSAFEFERLHLSLEILHHGFVIAVDTDIANNAVPFD